ncbi:palmitoyl acyltransferase 3, putative [Leishmania panamensis]|uniref:Palmitoyltransferase n=1 Tax=Leishmania panamensis TaxID=5679 RepID=A0A088RSP3_LEIPA|nr:palmitoyl acyltransferase 3, putative [Leishmania panamensis]AIN98239.1 palmitoyl acyltransferase 3, putative [Leishmania panamensis]
MDDWELVRYALERRQYLVAMWITLHKPRFIATFVASARVMGWPVIALGVALVTFTVVIIARNVVPVLATPGTVSYGLLQALVVLVSFNIYVNYFCATTFSWQIGKAPAEYAYRDPHATNPADAPHVDSNSSEDSHEDSEHANDGGQRISRNAQEMSSVAPRLQLAQHAFSSPHKGAEAPGGTFDVTLNASSSPRVPLPAVTGGAVSSRPPLPVTNFAGIRVVHVYRGYDSADRDAAVTVPLSQPNAAVVHRRGGMGSLLACPISLTRRARTVCPGRECHLGCMPYHSRPEASLATLLELETLAGVAEHYPPRLRAARVLDAPRRYCHHCRRLKAPREHHCVICDECIAKMDHHCPWINNCVGAENQRYFLLLVWWLWAGTLLASTFMGYGYIHERSNARKLRHLRRQWRTSPYKAAVEAELRALRMPYGPAGVLLTSSLAILTLGLTVIIFLCMSLFLYVNQRLVLENTTAIECIYVDEKRKRVYQSTDFTYRNPYDLGKWLNFVDLFSPARDPFVKMELEAEAETARKATVNRPGGWASDRGPRWRSTARQLVQRLAVVVWLTGFPTFRPIYGDGVHYPIFDSLASGEPHPLLAV